MQKSVTEEEDHRKIYSFYCLIKVSMQTCELIYLSGLILNAVRNRKTDIEVQKNIAMSINSKREKMLPPRKRPRVPPIELRRSIIVNGSNLVT